MKDCVNTTINVFSWKGTSTISSPLARWIWRRLSGHVRSAELRSPKSDSSMLPGNSQGWTTARLAGWLMAASDIPSPGHEQTAAPRSRGCAALASHLPSTNMESTATSQMMNKCRTLSSTPLCQKWKVDTDFFKMCIQKSMRKKKSYFIPVLFSCDVLFYILHSCLLKLFR